MLSPFTIQGQRTFAVMRDRCVPWHTVPAYVNRWFALGVAESRLRMQAGVDHLFVVAFAPKPAGADEARSLDGWLLTFERPIAYRWRAIPSWDRSVAFPRPDDMDVGAWEIVESSWLSEVTPPGYV